jgi:hypothetical protein
MLLGPLVPDAFADHRHSQSVHLLVELLLGVGGEDGASGVVLLAVDGDGEWDLDGADGVVDGDFCEVDFEVDEGFVGAVEEVFGVVVLGDEGFEAVDGGVDLIFVEFDEGDAFLFFGVLQFSAFEDVLVVRQVLLEGVDFGGFLLRGLLFRLRLLHFLSHC